MRSLPYYYVRLRPDFAWAGRTFHVRRRCGGVIPWTRPGREMTRTRSSGRETRARKEGRMNDHHRCRTIHLALGSDAAAVAVRPSGRRGGLEAKTSPYLSRSLNWTWTDPPSISPSLTRSRINERANAGEFSTQSQVREHLH